MKAAGWEICEFIFILRMQKSLVNLWQESEISVNGQQIQIVSSQNISRGGCFVDGQFGIVDGRVEEQIDQIAESLKPVLTNLGNGRCMNPVMPVDLSPFSRSLTKCNSSASFWPCCPGYWINY